MSMLEVLRARWKQGHRTASYPKAPPALPDRLRGLPVIDATKCPEGCHACADACPMEAIAGTTLDMGRCLFCTECADACTAGALTWRADHRLAARTRDDLLRRAGELDPPKLAALDAAMRRLFGRSLKLRQVSAGGCNACEADINVLTTVGFDLGRFGIQIVASPRHADGVLITGPVTENMKLALEKTWATIPDPKIAIAVGVCAISGGPYAGHPEAHDGAAGIAGIIPIDGGPWPGVGEPVGRQAGGVPIDLYIPGCPPHPYTILDGMLALIGRIERGHGGR